MHRYRNNVWFPVARNGGVSTLGSYASKCDKALCQFDAFCDRRKGAIWWVLRGWGRTPVHSHKHPVKIVKYTEIKIIELFFFF